MKFKPGNKLAAKEKWNLFEIRQFQKDLAHRRQSLNYSNEDLAAALDYSTKYIRMLQGEWGYKRQPSQEFLRRYQVFNQSNPQAKPSFQPFLAHDPGRDCIPLSQVLVPYKQCPECVKECERGYREENLTWWVMRDRRQKYHSVEHRKAAQRRRYLQRKRKEKRNAKAKGRALSGLRKKDAA